jgi:glutamate synthase (NADPH/NADH) large chain
VNYFFFVAEELRQLMAQMGVRSVNELIGRSDLLDMQKGITHWKARGLDYSRIFNRPAAADETPVFHQQEQDHGLAKALDNELIALARPALERGEKVGIDLPVRNLNRTVGAMLSGRLAERYGHAGLPDGTIEIRLKGTAGQSFGAFLARGVTLDLVGEGNDYVGKGLSGGRIIVRPHAGFRGEALHNIIVGNTVLYGATEGEAYFAGVAGERFAVRNSGATAVVEGVGDHGCEYMTGGTVVVLGLTGRNFAAGMSGGVAYVFDEEGTFESRCNMAQVSLEPVEEEFAARQGSDAGDELEGHGKVDVRHLGVVDEVLLKGLVEKHHRHTGSLQARRLLDDWGKYRAKFVKIMPHEYRRVLTEIAAQKQLEAA